MRSYGQRRTASFVRLLLASFGLAAFAWAAVVLPSFWKEAAISQAATRIIAGDVYSTETLAVLMARFDSANRVRPASRGSEAIVRLRLFENNRSQGGQDTQFYLASLVHAVADVVMSAPNSSYQWLVLFWAQNQLSGFDSKLVDYLRMSYETGPLEGWVALRRNGIVFSLYAALSEDLKSAALSEFLGLVRYQFYAEAAEVYRNSTPVAREVQTAGLRQLKDDTQARVFAKVLYDKGILDEPLPAFTTPRSRPWR